MIDSNFLDVWVAHLNQLTGADAETPFVRRLKAEEAQKAKMLVKPSTEVTTDLDQIADEVRQLTTTVNRAFNVPLPPALPISKPPAPTPPRKRVIIPFQGSYAFAVEKRRSVKSEASVPVDQAPSEPSPKRRRPTRSRKRVP